MSLRTTDAAQDVTPAPADAAVLAGLTAARALLDQQIEQLTGTAAPAVMAAQAGPQPGPRPAPQVASEGTAEATPESRSWLLTEDGIKLYPPADPDSKFGKYWRVEYTEDGRKRQTKGGRTERTALAKAADIAARLRRGGTSLGELAGRQGIDHYLDPSRYKERCRRRGGKWSEEYQDEQVRLVDVHVRPVLDDLRCRDWALRDFERVISSTSTPKEGERVKRLLSGMVKVLAKKGYLDATQVFLVQRADWVAPPGWLNPRPERFDKKLVSGETASFVSEDEIPPLEMRNALMERLDAFYPHGRLFYEVSCYVGCRLGELLALTCDDVHPFTGAVSINWRVNANGTRLRRPKGGKIRTAVVPTLTPDHPDFAARFQARVAAAAAEKAACARGESRYNPKGLIFPAPGGGYWSQSNFRTRVYDRAAESTVWTSRDGERHDSVPKVEWTTSDGKPRRDWKFTLHSARHVFATTAINVWKLDPDVLCTIGGWEDTKTIWDTYYGRSKHNIAQASAALRPADQGGGAPAEAQEAVAAASAQMRAAP